MCERYCATHIDRHRISGLDRHRISGFASPEFRQRRWVWGLGVSRCLINEKKLLNIIFVAGKFQNTCSLTMHIKLSTEPEYLEYVLNFNMLWVAIVSDGTFVGINMYALQKHV